MYHNPNKVLCQKNVGAKKVAVVSKAKGAVRRVVCPPTRPYFPANSTHNKRPFYPHNNLPFPHSPHQTLVVTRASPRSPQGGSTIPPGPPTPLLTWGPAGGVERRNISKMWHCLLSGCLG